MRVDDGPTLDQRSNRLKALNNRLEMSSYHPMLGRVVDQSSVEALYLQERDRMWLALTAFCGDRHVAEEAVAEAFAQVLGRGREVRDPARWVWKVAFRIAGGEMKRRGRHQGLPEIEYQQEEPAWDLVEALAQLSERQRACLILFHFAGYPTGEVGRIVGTTSGAVRVHLSVGRRRLSLEPPKFGRNDRFLNG